MAFSEGCQKYGLCIEIILCLFQRLYKAMVKRAGVSVVTDPHQYSNAITCPSTCLLNSGDAEVPHRKAKYSIIKHLNNAVQHSTKCR
jgi:hypothetical protein